MGRTPIKTVVLFLFQRMASNCWVFFIPWLRMEWAIHPRPFNQLGWFVYTDERRKAVGSLLPDEINWNVPGTIATSQTTPKLSGVRKTPTLLCSQILWVRDSESTQRDNLSLLHGVENCKNLAGMTLSKPLQQETWQNTSMDSSSLRPCPWDDPAPAEFPSGKAQACQKNEAFVPANTWRGRPLTSLFSEHLLKTY